MTATRALLGVALLAACLGTGEALTKCYTCPTSITTAADIEACKDPYDSPKDHEKNCAYGDKYCVKLEGTLSGATFTRRGCQKTSDKPEGFDGELSTCDSDLCNSSGVLGVSSVLGLLALARLLLSF